MSKSPVLPSGLIVVTDAMSHLETASLGVWVGSGSRDEKPNEHGISHLLEHMAFKGTTRRSARQIAEEIEAVGGDLNAATSRRDDGLLCARAQGRCAARARRALRHSRQSVLRSGRARARAERDRAGNRRGRRRPGRSSCSNICRKTAFPDQPIGRSILGTRESVCALQARRSAHLSVAQLSRARHGGDRRPARSNHADVVDEAEQRFASFSGRRRRCRFRPRSAAARMSKRAISNRRISPSALEGLPQRDPDLYSPAGLRKRAGRRNVVAAVPGSARDARALLFDLLLSTRPIPTPVSSGSMPAPIREDRAGIDAGRDRSSSRAPTETVTEAEVARAKAQMKAGLLMALESSSARAEQLARQIFAWGRPMPLAEIVAKIEAVTVESVRPPGRILIARNRPAIAALGPGKGLEQCGHDRPRVCSERPRWQSGCDGFLSGCQRHRALPRDPGRRRFPARAANVAISRIGLRCASRAATSSRPGSRSGRPTTSPAAASSGG